MKNSDAVRSLYFVTLFNFVFKLTQTA